MSEFLSENFQLLVVKFSIYLNGRVFVMIFKNNCLLLMLQYDVKVPVSRITCPCLRAWQSITSKYLTDFLKKVNTRLKTSWVKKNQVFEKIVWAHTHRVKRQNSNL